MCGLPRLAFDMGIARSVCVALAALTFASCSPATAPTPTVDPFAAVADQANQAYEQGQELYQQGRRAEALSAFQRAQLLSPHEDPRIDGMVQRIAAELTPTATPAPPTATPAPEPTSVVESSATPATELAEQYFGQTFLTIVPGQDGVPPAMTAFSDQDQIALYLANLNQRMVLAFELRIFNADSGQLVADTSSDTVKRFRDNYVWYHAGGDPPGHYRAELFAANVLADTFEYVVGNVPVVIPTETPVPTPQPVAVNQAPPVATPQPPARPAQPPTPSEPLPESVPEPPAAPTPAPMVATTIAVAGGPAAVTLLEPADQLYVADRSGAIWPLDHSQPTLRAPLGVAGEPVGLAADPTTQHVFVAVRGQQPAIAVLDSASGQQIGSVALPADPGDLRLDPELGLAFVVSPADASVTTVDVRGMTVVRSTGQLPLVTGLAVDEHSHTLYTVQLNGVLAAVDEQSGQITNRWTLTDVGLTDVALGGDQIFAINTPGHELIRVDRASGAVAEVPLGAEPTAIGIGPQSGAVYVLEVQEQAVVRLDPNDGTEQGRAELGGDEAESPSLAPDQLWLRPRMTVSPVDEGAYAIEPRAGVVAIVPPQE